MLNELAPSIEHCLRQGGWYPGRHVDPTCWLKPLEQEGFSVSPPADQILRVLGGLRFDPPESDDQAFRPAPFDFLPLEAGSGQRDIVEVWEGTLKRTLFPLGEVFRYMTLLVADDGRIYAGETDTLHFIGDNIDRALETLINAPSTPSVLP